MSQPAPVQTASLQPGAAGSGASVQRAAEEEEEDVQASHDRSLPDVQREEEEQEEQA